MTFDFIVALAVGSYLILLFIVLFITTKVKFLAVCNLLKGRFTPFSTNFCLLLHQSVLLFLVVRVELNLKVENVCGSS